MKRLVVLVTVVMMGCAAILDTGTGRRVELVAQRGEHDCGIAALAMLLDRPYDAIDHRRVQLGIDMSDGLYARDVILLAYNFGVKLVFADEPNPATDSGIVVMQPTWDAPYAHAVYLFHAYVYDPADATAPTPYVLAWSHWAHVYYFLKDTRVFDAPVSGAPRS